MMTRYRDLSFLARYHRGLEFAGWLSGAGSKHLTNGRYLREYLRQHLPHRDSRSMKRSPTLLLPLLVAGWQSITARSSC